MTTFRLLHVSDLHIAEEPDQWDIVSAYRLFRKWELSSALQRARLPWVTPSSYDRDLARAVARFAKTYAEKVDVILVTGDIATTGLAADLRTAHQFISASPARGSRSINNFPTLNSSRLPIFLLPGNHDRFGSSYTASPNDRRFDTVFSAFWPSGAGVSVNYVRRRNEALCVIAADFTLERRDDAHSIAGVWGQGRVYASRLRSLVQATVHARTQQPEPAVVWAIHFPPVSSDVEPALSLIDGRAVAVAARLHNVPFIFAGHVHVAGRYEYSSAPNVTVWCAGTATSVNPDDLNTIHLLDIEVGKGAATDLTCRTYRWSQNAGEFTRSPDLSPVAVNDDLA